MKEKLCNWQIKLGLMKLTYVMSGTYCLTVMDYSMKTKLNDNTKVGGKYWRRVWQRLKLCTHS
jgi:hypothetical protein